MRRIRKFIPSNEIPYETEATETCMNGSHRMYSKIRNDEMQVKVELRATTLAAACVDLSAAGHSGEIQAVLGM
eukprot:g72515.t1